MDKYEIEDIYKKWWKDKYLSNGKKIIDVIFTAPPSGVYGVVTLKFYDGTESIVITPPNAFRPRKKDLEVFENNPK